MTFTALRKIKQKEIGETFRWTNENGETKMTIWDFMAHVTLYVLGCVFLVSARSIEVNKQKKHCIDPRLKVTFHHISKMNNYCYIDCVFFLCSKRFIKYYYYSVCLYIKILKTCCCTCTQITYLMNNLKSWVWHHVRVFFSNSFWWW